MVSPFAVAAKLIQGYVLEKTTSDFFGRKFHHEFIMPTVFSEDGGSDLFESVRELQSSPKIAACIAHFCDGLSWEDTGIIESGMRYIEKSGKKLDGYSTSEGLVRRYEKIDRLYDYLAGGGELYSDSVNDPIVHIGMNGEIFFAGGAHHRTALAWILDIHLPVRPFLIHVKGKYKLAEMLHHNSPLPEQLRDSAGN